MNLTIADTSEEQDMPLTQQVQSPPLSEGKQPGVGMLVHRVALAHNNWLISP